MIKHANKERFAKEAFEDVDQQVTVSDKMWKELNELPFFSGKRFLNANIFS